MGILDYLDGQLPDEIRRALEGSLGIPSGLSSSPHSSFIPVAATTDELHVYADYTNGDNGNDGLSLAAAKQTVHSAIEIIPYHARHNFVLHVSGAHPGAVPAVLNINVDGGLFGIIDAGSALSVVADAGGVPWVADISSASSLGLTTAGWTINQYRGYAVEVIDGAAAGQTRSIHSNTATTITPGRNWSTDPGAAQFRIVQPLTTVAHGIEINKIGTGSIRVQRMSTTGSGFFLTRSFDDSGITFSH